MKSQSRKKIQTILLALMTISRPVYASTVHKENHALKSTKNSQADQYTDEKLVRPYSPRSIQQGARFLALAIQAWNPSLRATDMNTLINLNIRKYGVLNGLVNPALALVDISFAAGKPEFANLLNPMLKDIAPDVASVMNKKFGMALDYEGQGFDNISKFGTAEIWDTMTLTLGESFYSQNPDSNQPAAIDPQQSILGQTLTGRGSYFKYSLSRELKGLDINQNIDPIKESHQNGIPGRHNDYTSTPGYGMAPDTAPKKPFTTNNRGLTSTPGQTSGPDGEGRPKRPKGPLTNRDLVSYNTCMAQCFGDAGTLGGTGVIIGKYLGTVLGGAPGGVIGQIGGGIIGVGLGLNDCSHSKACNGGDGDKGTPEPKKPEPNEPQPRSEPKDPEPKDPQPKSEPKDPEPKDPQPLPEPRPTPDSKPEPITTPDPKPAETPPPQRTPPEDSKGDGGDDGGDKKDDNDKRANVSKALRIQGKGILVIPGLERPTVQLKPKGTINPINSTPSFGRNY